MKKSKYIVVVAHGASRSGKDSLLRVLRQSLIRAGITTCSLDFATPLRAATCALIGCTPDQLADTTFRKTPHPLLLGKNPVEFMQQLGTEYLRNQVNSDFFCDRYKHGVQAVLEWAADSSDRPFVVLTSDCRFEDETQAVYDVLPDAQIVHCLVHNDRADFGMHESDKMNKAWICYGQLPAAIPPKEHGRTTIYNFVNNGTLPEYSRKVLDWTDEFFLQFIAK